jgi:hypothetical protein
MDDCLPFESMADATIRTLLAQERTRRAELEQEVRRLQAGLVRQNKRILDLERRDADRERELAAQRELVAALTEQNRLLRQQVA